LNIAIWQKGAVLSEAEVSPPVPNGTFGRTFCLDFFCLPAGRQVSFFYQEKKESPPAYGNDKTRKLTTLAFIN